jgi:hypothetical protein
MISKFRVRVRVRVLVILGGLLTFFNKKCNIKRNFTDDVVSKLLLQI